MRLNAQDLRDIADKIEALQAVDGVHVNQITVKGYDLNEAHYIILEKEGDKYVVRGISDKPIYKFGVHQQLRSTDGTRG
jgi:hypothetical protein